MNRDQEPKSRTYERNTVPQVCAPHAIDFHLILDGHHLLDERRHDGVPEVGQHKGDSIRGLRRDEELAFSPRAASEEGPEFRVVLPLDLDPLEVGSDFVIDFRRLDEDGSILKSDKEVGVEQRVVRDIGATEVEGVRWGER